MFDRLSIVDHNEQLTQNSGLFDELEMINSQPLEERAAGFEKLYEELVEQLQSSDGQS